MRVLPALGLAFALLSSAPAASAGSGNYRAHLSGADEVPVRETRATGQALIRFTDAGLEFLVLVANIDNVRAAHIHCGGPADRGPVGVTLFSEGGLGRVNGILARGDADTPDDGNECGWTSLADVEGAILDGQAYVNVHTNDGVAPADTGPGDFPGGEIRGHLH